MKASAFQRNALRIAGLLAMSVAAASSWAADPTSMQVYVYEDVNYNGNYMLFNGIRDEPDLRNYNTGAPGSPTWNDRISSLKVGSGVKLKVYKDINYKGSSWTVTGPATISTLVSNGWNDKISSFHIVPK